MKKILLVAIVANCCISFSASAQNFGAHIGGSFAKVTNSFKESGISYSIGTDAKFGLTAGAFMELPLRKSFGFRPEINFSQKGFKLNFSEGEDKVTGEETYNYLELPLIFTYKLNAGSGQVLLGAGPYFGFGISGKTKSTITVGGQTETMNASVKFDGKTEDEVTDNNTHLKALDAGLSFLGGYQLKNGLVFTAGYGLGLSDLSPDNYLELKNRNFTIKVGYLFNKK